MIGCSDPHGYYPFPASREVCPKCIAIRAKIFTPRHGLRYRWWKDIRWDLIATCIAVALLCFTLAFLVAAWWLDLKPEDLPW